MPGHGLDADVEGHGEDERGAEVRPGVGPGEQQLRREPARAGLEGQKLCQGPSAPPPSSLVLLLSMLDPEGRKKKRLRRVCRRRRRAFLLSCSSSAATADRGRRRPLGRRRAPPPPPGRLRRLPGLKGPDPSRARKAEAESQQTQQSQKRQRRLGKDVGRGPGDRRGKGPRGLGGGLGVEHRL